MFVKTIITNFIVRQEAVDYMVANTALSRVAVEREVKIFFECQYFLKIDIFTYYHESIIFVFIFNFSG